MASKPTVHGVYAWSPFAGDVQYNDIACGQEQLEAFVSVQKKPWFKTRLKWVTRREPALFTIVPDGVEERFVRPCDRAIGSCVIQITEFINTFVSVVASADAQEKKISDAAERLREEKRKRQEIYAEKLRVYMSSFADQEDKQEEQENSRQPTQKNDCDELNKYVASMLKTRGWWGVFQLNAGFGFATNHWSCVVADEIERLWGGGGINKQSLMMILTVFSDANVTKDLLSLEMSDPDGHARMDASVSDIVTSAISLVNTL